MKDSAANVPAGIVERLGRGVALPARDAEGAKHLSEAPIGNVTKEERAVDVEGAMFIGEDAILEKPMGLF
jgi:hypothetical protein